MENNKINFFTRIGQSISNYDFYRIIVKESLGKAFGYLILFSLMISVLSCIKPVYDTNKAIGLVINHFESDIPYFELKNGELQVEGDMPIVFENENSIMVIDTRENPDESVIYGYQQGFLVTKTKMVSKEGFEKTEYTFKDFGAIDFNKKDVQKFLPSLKVFLIPIIIIGIILWTIIGKLLSSLFVSLLGVVVNSMLHGNLKYGDIYKIGIYSLTFPSIIKFIIRLMPYKIPYLSSMFFFIYYGLVILYIVKAIHSIKREGQFVGPNYN